MIEVELRTFLNDNQYLKLIEFFKEDSINNHFEKQITYYYNCPQDFRLMLTKSYCQLWLKKGNLHDDAREELVVKMDINYRENLTNMLKELGYNLEIKWYRERNTFDWKNIKVTVDYTHGYGYIIELEDMAETEEQISDKKDKLQKLFKELELDIVEKNVFKERYEDYKINWSKYTANINESAFLKN